MTLSQILPQLLSTNLVTVREAPKVVNTTSPKYNPNARCAYHSDSPGHSTDDCWALRNKVQDLIDAKEIQFEAPERPNVVTAPMPHVVPQNLPSHFSTRNRSFRHFLIFQIGSRIGQTDFSRQSNKN